MMVATIAVFSAACTVLVAIGVIFFGVSIMFVLKIYLAFIVMSSVFVVLISFVASRIPASRRAKTTYADAPLARLPESKTVRAGHSS